MYDWFPGFPGGGSEMSFFRSPPVMRGIEGGLSPSYPRNPVVPLEVFKDHANPLQETFSGGSTFGCWGWTFCCGG